MDQKKIAVIWMTLVMLFSFIVIVVEMPQTVKASMIWVDDSFPSEDPTHKKTIQAGLDAANPGDTVFVYNGTYYENVVVNKAINLIGEDMNTTIVDASYNGVVIYVSGDWVNITGFTVTKSGNIPGPIGDAGIELNNVQNCRIFDNIAINNFNGIFLNSSSNNTIDTNICISNFDYGIYLFSSWWNNISNNNASSNFDDGIRLKSSSENFINNNIVTLNSLRGMFIDSSNNNTISGNTVLNNNLGIYLYYSNENNLIGNNASNNNAGFILHYSNMNNVTSNNASNNGAYGIGLYSSIGNIISNNIMIEDGLMIEGDLVEHWNTHEIETSNTVNGNPIYYLKNQTGGAVPQSAGEVILANCSNISIKNQELSNGTVGILLGFSSNNTIISNNVTSNRLYGIYLSHSIKNYIVNNNFSSNEYYGIYVEYSNKNNITTNNVTWNKIVGINLQNSLRNMIYKNNIQNNLQMNIYLYSSSNNNTVSYNTVLNYGAGVAFWLSANNSIIYNIISNTSYAVTLGFSSNNITFHHNNFINNQNQVYMETSCSNIVWDDGYGEGNYWSDYPGIDDGSNGRTAGDGVGDTEIPHPFTDQGNGYYQLDSYPLMNPVGNYIFLYAGWNLISLPFIQSDTNLDAVLSSIRGSYDAVQWYNASDNSDHWKHNSTKKPYQLNDLDIIDHIVGFWIHITKPGGILLQYQGTQPTSNQTITLHPGWNMVGYPSLTSYNRTEGLNNLTFDDQVDAIWSYDAATQKWEEMGESEYFEIGKGYYIHAKSECEWEVPL